jgi:hypothetical protein
MVGRRIEPACYSFQLPLSDQTTEVVAWHGQTLQIGRPYDGLLFGESLLEVCRKVPQAVVCLSSALRFHELTTESPFEVWIALKPGAWSPRIEYPPIRVIRVSGEALTFGVMEHFVEGFEIKV